MNTKTPERMVAFAPAASLETVWIFPERRVRLSPDGYTAVNQAPLSLLELDELVAPQVTMIVCHRGGNWLRNGVWCFERDALGRWEHVRQRQTPLLFREMSVDMLLRSHRSLLALWFTTFVPRPFEESCTWPMPLSHRELQARLNSVFLRFNEAEQTEIAWGSASDNAATVVERILRLQPAFRQFWDEEA